mmetsp:Transcript_4429/g.7688  ORF Transcript_4429/g.7688 Transcript_4429/m.7688 type:complete len:137 (+) Transcript_4429:398-808(+)
MLSISKVAGRVAYASRRYIQNRTTMSASASSAKIAVYVTVPSKELGVKIANSLLTDKLAACVNIIPGIESYYWWENKIESDSELLLMIKSRSELLEAITARVVEVHEYDVPEVISVPILGGNEKYLKWIQDNTKSF